MFKRQVIYKFTNLLNSKSNRYYWTPSNEEMNKLFLIKQKYNIPEDITQLLEEQEQCINNIKTKFTYLQENQQKIIEKIYSKSQTYDPKYPNK